MALFRRTSAVALATAPIILSGALRIGTLEVTVLVQSHISSTNFIRLDTCAVACMTDGSEGVVDGSAKSKGLLQPLPSLKSVPGVDEKVDAGLRGLDHCERGLCIRSRRWNRL